MTRETADFLPASTPLCKDLLPAGDGSLPWEHICIRSAGHAGKHKCQPGCSTTWGSAG